MHVIDEEILGHTIISAKKVHTYLDKYKKGDFKQWVAIIKGPCKKFGFEREFVKKKQTDFRPDFFQVEYELENGKLYQYKNLYVAMGEYVSGFFAVNESGELISLIQDEVRVLMNMPVKKWGEKNNDKPKFKLEEYAHDDVPF